MRFDDVLSVSRWAAKIGGPGPLSTGEALTAALVLNRADWLKDMGYTIAEALARIDDDTVRHLRAAERRLQNEGVVP